MPVRGLACRTRCDLFDLTDEMKSRAGIGANWFGSLKYLAAHHAKRS